MLFLLSGAACAQVTISVADGDTAGLVAAIQTAQANGGGTIYLAPEGHYLVTAPTDWWYGPNAFPAITTTTVIEGEGATIERDPTKPKFRFFYVAGGFSTVPAGNLTIHDLTFLTGLARGGNGGSGFQGGGGGAGMGGAIFNQGTLTLESVVFNGNQAVGGSGGNGGGGGSAGGGGLGGDGASTTGGLTEYSGGGGGMKTNGRHGCFYQSPTCGPEPDQHGQAAGGYFTGNEWGRQHAYGGTSPYGGNGGNAGGNVNPSGLGGSGGAGGGGFYPGDNGKSNSGSSAGGGGTGGGRGGNGGAAVNLYGGGGGAFGGGGGGAENAGGGGGGVGGGGGGGYNSGGYGGFGGGGAGGPSGGAGGFGGGAGGWYGFSGYNGGGAGFGGGTTSGYPAGGGGAFGGAVFNHEGTLTIQNSEFDVQSAKGGTGKNVGQGFGGAVFNVNGTVQIANSKFISDSVADGAGGNTGNGSELYNLSHAGAKVTGPETPTATMTLANLASLSGTELVNNQANGTATVTTITTDTISITAPEEGAYGVPFPVQITRSNSGRAVNVVVTGVCNYNSGTGMATMTAGSGICRITADYVGSATPWATMTTATVAAIKATVAVNLVIPTPTYDGNPHLASATTTPPGFTVLLSYERNGSPVASPLSAGTYSVTGTISDPNYQGSATSPLVVAPAPATAIADFASRPFYANNPTFTGTSSGFLPADGITVSYVTTATQSSPVGRYAITPMFSDPNNKLSNYAVLSTQGLLTITKGSTALQLAGSTAINVGDQAVFTATITPTPFSQGLLKGQVTYYDGATNVGSATPNSSNYAQRLVHIYGAGNHTVSATYGGDSNYSSSTGTMTVTVADFSLTPSPASQTITVGTSKTFHVAVNSLFGPYTATVSFSCAPMVMPLGTTCSFLPATATGGGSTTMTVTIPPGATVPPGGTGTVEITGHAAGATHNAQVSVAVAP